MDSRSLLSLRALAQSAPKQQTIAEEAGLGPEWAPVDRPPIIPGSVDSSAKNFTASLPPAYQHDSSFVNTAYKSSTAPSHSLMPLGVQGNAITNAAIQSTSGKVFAASPVTSSGSAISLTLTAPLEIIVSGSPTSGATPEIDLTWAPEAGLTVFSGPNSSAPGFDGAFPASVTGSGSLLTAAGTPSLSSGEYAVYIASGVQTTSFIPFTGGTPAGWTALAGSVAIFPQFARAITSAVSVTETWSGSDRITSMIVYLKGALPAFTNTASAITGPGPISAALTGLTVGNSILVLCSAQIATPVTTGILSDSQVNIPILLGTVGIPATSGGSVRGSQVFVYLIPSVTSSSDTVTFSVSPTSASSGLQMALYEIPTPSAIAGVPRFQPFPPTNVTSAIGILSPVNGGTGAALNTTGGTSQVVMQTTVGAAFTVTQLAASDLTNGTTGSTAVVLASAPTINNPVISGKVTSYNGTTTVGNGVPSEIKTVDLTNQSAAIVATNLTTAAPSGMSRISWVATVTQAATTSCSLGGTNGLQLTYQDQDTSVTKTTLPSVVSALNNTGTGVISGVILVNAAINSTITYQMDYTSVGGTAMQYNLHIKLEAM